MRALRAYIASLGTTGVLVASSLLMLVLVSSIVAFRGWPDGLAGGVRSLLGGDRPSLRLSGPAQLAANAAPAAAAVAGAPAAGSPAAAVLRTGGSGDGTPAPKRPTRRDEGASTPRDVLTPAPAPTQRGTGTGSQTPPTQAPDVGGVTRQLGDTTEGATRDLGGTVGNANPQLAQGVTDTGKALADLVRDVGATLQPAP